MDTATRITRAALAVFSLITLSASLYEFMTRGGEGTDHIYLAILAVVLLAWNAVIGVGEYARKPLNVNVKIGSPSLDGDSTETSRDVPSRNLT